MSDYGFTGTRRGMTMRQGKALKRILDVDDGAPFHHGDCVGADAQAHVIAVAEGKNIVVHPPINDAYRAFCKAPPRKIPFQDVEIRPAESYQKRNHNIVEECDILIAAPRTLKEEHRSGTWAVIRFARKLHRPIIILDP